MHQPLEDVDVGDRERGEDQERVARLFRERRTIDVSHWCRGHASSRFHPQQRRQGKRTRRCGRPPALLPLPNGWMPMDRKMCSFGRLTHPAIHSTNHPRCNRASSSLLAFFLRSLLMAGETLSHRRRHLGRDYESPRRTNGGGFFHSSSEESWTPITTATSIAAHSTGKRSPSSATAVK